MFVQSESSDCPESFHRLTCASACCSILKSINLSHHNIWTPHNVLVQAPSGAAKYASSHAPPSPLPPPPGCPPSEAGEILVLGPAVLLLLPELLQRREERRVRQRLRRPHVHLRALRRGTRGSATRRRRRQRAGTGLGSGLPTKGERDGALILADGQSAAPPCVQVEFEYSNIRTREAIQVQFESTSRRLHHQLAGAFESTSRRLHHQPVGAFGQG